MVDIVLEELQFSDVSVQEKTVFKSNKTVKKHVYTLVNEDMGYRAVITADSPLNLVKGVYNLKLNTEQTGLEDFEKKEGEE